MKILTAYFSRRGLNYAAGSIVDLPVGNTEAAAKMIAELTGCDLYEIERAEPYSKEYRGCVDEAKAELAANARPALKTAPPDISAYDAVILGYPNWCGTMPMPVWTFLESGDFSGKVIAPFCTNEGSGLKRSVDDINRLCPGADQKEGLSIRGCQVGSARGDIERWLKKLGLI